MDLTLNEDNPREALEYLGFITEAKRRCGEIVAGPLATSDLVSGFFQTLALVDCEDLTTVVVIAIAFQDTLRAAVNVV